MRTSQPNLRREYVSVFALAILAAVVFQSVPVVRALRAYVHAPFQFDYEEGNILNALARISQGQTPYPDPHALPNVINPYGPVAYYALALPVKLWGLSFFAGRVAILACVLLICLQLADLVRRYTRSPLLGFAFGLLYAVLPVVSGWTWLLRVDFLAILFAVLGLASFARMQLRDQNLGSFRERRFLVPALWFSAALLAKYSLLAAPAACALQLVGERRWRELARFITTIAIVCAAVLAIFAAATRGAILIDLFRSHPDPFVWNAYLLRMWRMVAVHWPLLALAVVAAVCGLLRQLPPLPVLWLLLATIGAVTAGKLGSGWNHFLEWPAALCVCAALGLHTLSRLPTRAVAFVLTSAAAAWVLWFVLRPQPQPDAFAPVEACPAGYAWVRDAAGPDLLSENVGAIVMARKQVWVSNPFVLNMLVTRAGWPDAQLARKIAGRGFDAILMSEDYAAVPHFLQHGTDRFSPAQLQAIAANYHVSRRFRCQGMNVVYTPNPLQSK